MGAPHGNNYWQFRNKHGRDYKYQPDQLWNEFIEYCKWIEETPLYEMKVFTFQGEIIKTNIPKMRAMTITGFCLYADIDNQTFDNYRNNKDFFGIITRIENAIRNQKFEGAAAELLNPNIIARELGLSDVRDNKSSDGTMTPKPNIVTTLSEAKLKQLIKK